MVEPSELIELFIYCRYLLETTKQTNITGILTGAINWHCFYLQKREQLMTVLNFLSKKDEEIIAKLPKLITRLECVVLLVCFGLILISLYFFFN